MSTLAFRFPSHGEIARMPILAHSYTLTWQRNCGSCEQKFRGNLERPKLKTIARYSDFHILLILMKAYTQMPQRHADARISIHATEGKIRLRLPNEILKVSTGELIALD